MSDGRNDNKNHKKWSMGEVYAPSRIALPESSKEAIKADNGKTEYHHFPPEALNQIAQAFTFGAKKYDAYNFRAGLDYSRAFNAAMRHLWAWWGGEEVDKESGLSHLSHAACCIIMLLDFKDHRTEKDDRYKKEVD